MQIEPISESDIRYNAAEQQFEASVTLHGSTGTRTYACAIAADLSLSMEQAAIDLGEVAIARHADAPGLFSAQRLSNQTLLRTPSRPNWRETLIKALPKFRAPRAA